MGCNKTIDCYTCSKIETCPQVDAAFGKDVRKNASAKSKKLCSNPTCPNERCLHSAYCAECRSVADRRKYAAQARSRRKEK